MVGFKYSALTVGLLYIYMAFLMATLYRTNVQIHNLIKISLIMYCVEVASRNGQFLFKI